MFGILIPNKNTIAFQKGCIVFIVFSRFVWYCTAITKWICCRPQGPLPGVNVVIKGTNTGTSTDFDGNFSIEKSSSGCINFSFVGFKAQEASLETILLFSISLEEEASFLDEIIVTGYGTQTRREVTASIVRVDSETIERVAAGSSVDAIKVKSLVLILQQQVVTRSESQVRIRGRRSLSASNDPLYVVDGIPVTSSVDGGTIFDIAPLDIESMEILKDAAATAIYGSRGANGVLITTKRGKQGEKTAVLLIYYGTAINVPDMMDAEQYKQMRAEALEKFNNEFMYDGNVETDLYVLFDGEQALVDNYNAGADFNYLDNILRKVHSNHPLSARGGTEKLLIMHHWDTSWKKV